MRTTSGLALTMASAFLKSWSVSCKVGADGGLQADDDQALVLGGDEFAGQDHEDPQRGQEEDQGAQQDQPRAAQAFFSTRA